MRREKRGTGRARTRQGGGKASGGRARPTRAAARPNQSTSC